MKKYLILLVVVPLLPSIANADYTYDYVDTPATVEANGVVARAEDGPHQTLTIYNDDKSHIASTAYVKGAYNDTIAAINSKQTELYNPATDEVIVSEVLNSEGFIWFLGGSGEDISSLENTLSSTAAIVNGIRSQRAVVYTTWDDDRDSATRQVAFVTASGN